MSSRRRRQLGFAAIAAAAAAYVMAALVLPDSSALKAVFRTGVHGGLMVAAAVLCVRSASRSQSGRAAWWCMAVGLVAYAAGEITWRLAYAGDPSPPYPSWADLCWLATYPAFYLGTLLLVRERLAALSASAWLDGVIGGAVTLALGLAFYFEPISRASDGDPLAVAMTMAYPLGDILLVALMVSVLALVGGRITRMWALLAAGQGLIMLSDMSYALGTATGTYAEGHWPDTLSPVGVLLIALAARAPASRALPARLEGWRAFALTALFGMAAIGLELLVDLFEFSVGVNVLAKLSVGLVVLRILLTVRENVELVARVQDQAHTDELTGLPNRRRLLIDLERGMLKLDRPRALTFLDLDGFKAYNDAFGHVAGDELLARLGAALARAVSNRGQAYRLGGDEFCILVEDEDESAADALLAAALAALSDRGEGFRVGASHGTVVIPSETADASLALKLADDRMYLHKARSRASAERQTSEVLVGLLSERSPHLGEHLAELGGWARSVALRLGLTPPEIGPIGLAAELHDVGKAAIPDAILDRSGPLSDAEWAFIRQHLVIGERILRRAPALKPAAALVRASHERHDGRGYPDGLADEQIPLGARIVAVCDAFSAMTSHRPHREALSVAAALAELRRCAGEQFDPLVVEAFCAVLECSPAPLVTGRHDMIFPGSHTAAPILERVGSGATAAAEPAQR